MTNARMIIENLVDTATVTLTKGAAIATMPVTHLQVLNNSRVFRTTSNDIEITVELASQQIINSLVLWRQNLLGNATVAFDVYDYGNALVYQSGELPAHETKRLFEMRWAIDPLIATIFNGWRLAYSVFWFNAVFAKKVVIKIKDPDNTNPIDIARLYMGFAIEPEYNFRYGNSIEWQDNAKGKDTAGGSSHHTESEVWREAKINLENITDGDYSVLFDGFRKVSTQKDWFISLYPSVGGKKERDHAFACKALKPVKFKNDNSRFHSAPIDLREV